MEQGLKMRFHAFFTTSQLGPSAAHKAKKTSGNSYSGVAFWFNPGQQLSIT